MKFYDRETELSFLREIEENSNSSAQMTLLMGRRRVGKTTLLKNAFSPSKTVLYFFVAKKNEVLLCEEFVQEVEDKLSVSLGRFQNFAQLFKALMIQSQSRQFTLNIDEFQEFANINPSIFSEIQNIWDSYKDTSKINLILCGSIYSIMKKIFENAKEPLFGRATSKIIVKPFAVSVIKQILKDFNPEYTPEDLLAFYMITGGIAKYVEQFVINKAFTKKRIMDTVFKENSFFQEEGKSVLVDEFGKDYGNYFSILSLIASSKTDRSDMESVLNMPVGGYLERLEKDYNLIKRHRPFGAKEGSRHNKYRIEDNFLNFWFRFIYKYRSAVEIGNLEYVRNIVERDYETYSGLILEKYFRSTLVESKRFSEIGSYWNKKGEDEIDIVALNERDKQLIFYEVKRNKKRINIPALEKKSAGIVRKYPDFHVEYKGLSLEEM
ncbi:MAG: ATP-binding protein [Prevotellaceae bacterium]|jgi:AAA+ ATPase superfamily predicted ATPase|nr:ATP-binding protein [Prevotellaceae bacterium]